MVSERFQNGRKTDFVRQLFITVNKMPDENNLEEDKFNLCPWFSEV